MEPTKKRRSQSRSLQPAWLAHWSLALGVVAGCTVHNPGLVPDEVLDTPAYLPLVVNGAAASVSDALAGGGGNVAVMTGGLLGDMFMAASSTGTTRQAKRGVLPPERTDWGGPNKAHRARWVAEDAVRRVERVLAGAAPTSPLYAEANLWAGFANRLLGDTFCSSIIDGGGEGPRVVYYQRAEAAFSNAIGVAMAANEQDLLHAALGGRASIRVILGNWPGAVEDAMQVPADFVFKAEFNSSEQNDPGTNQMWMEMWRRRNYSVAFTWFQQDYPMELEQLQPGAKDPRVTWHARKEEGMQSLASDNVTPLIAQGKYREGNSDVPLTKGAEMILILAENALNNGDVAGAMMLVNQVRTNAGAPPWPPTTDPAAALEYLKKERGIVLWLEGRRGGEFFRWKQANPAFDTANDSILTQMNMNAIAFDMSEHGDIEISGRATCYQISESIRQVNPNLGPVMPPML